MSQLYQDLFTRADGGLGANWTTTTGLVSPSIVSNEARNSGAAPAGARYTATSLPDDQYAEITVGSVVSTTSDEGVGPAARMASGSHSSYFAQTNTTQTRLYKVVSGAYTQLGSDAAACTSGQTLRVTCNGTSISASINGSVVIGPVTDASLSSGDGGIWCTDPGGPGTIADAAGGDLSTAPTSFPPVRSIGQRIAPILNF